MINRRGFLRFGFVAGASCPVGILAAVKRRELRVTRVVVQEAVGRRLSPVAPNAYAGYRGYEVKEAIVRIQTAQGVEGVGRATVPTAALREFLGKDPFALFRWDGDRILGAAEDHAALLDRLKGGDVAVLDLLGKVLKVPVWKLLGKSVRERVPIYDSSLYMEDLLKPEELRGLAYLKDEKVPADPVELVARKARWVVQERAEEFKAVKIKIGRVKWMSSFREALERDIAVTNAVREAVGPRVRICVDGNKGYEGNKAAVIDYAAGVRKANVYFMEEMFGEKDVEAMRELKSRLRAEGDRVKLAAGESFTGGIPENVYRERFGKEPLVEIEQADMNAHGFLKLRAKAAEQSKLGMTLAPHNFGSKMGFYAQLHLGRCVPNFEIAETDDSEFPAFVPEGVKIQRGLATLTGKPGLGVELREEFLGRATFEVSV